MLLAFMTTLCKKVEVIAAGQPFDAGLSQGLALRNKIHHAWNALSQLEAFRLQQPWWLPYEAYCWVAANKARRFLEPCLLNTLPSQTRRLDGIAAGAELPLRSIYLFNALEPVLSSVGGCTACPSACSAVAVRGRRSAQQEPILVRNFDYLPLVQPYYVIRDSRPDGKLRSLEFTTAPLAGAVDGMNENGLCITYNYAYTIDIPGGSAVPISMLISEALQHCSTVSEAAQWIAAQPRWGGGILMLADASGDIAALELSSTQSFLKRPADGCDYLFHTNQFYGSIMKQVQSPEQAVFTNLAPTPLRGKQLHLSAQVRDQRLEQLLSKPTAHDGESLHTIMADHGEQQSPTDTTICVHSNYWNTTACLQFFPRSRTMRVSYSSACQAEFEDITF